MGEWAKISPVQTCRVETRTHTHTHTNTLSSTESAQLKKKKQHDPSTPSRTAFIICALWMFVSVFVSLCFVCVSVCECLERKSESERRGASFVSSHLGSVGLRFSQHPSDLNALFQQTCITPVKQRPSLLLNASVCVCACVCERKQ